MSRINAKYHTFLAELIGGFIFSMTYYLWLGRTSSAYFNMGFLDLSMAVGIIYLLAVFISSYDYRADIFPIFSIFRCFAERSLNPLYVNISGQVIGTLVGFGLYAALKNSLLTTSPFASLTLLSQIPLNSDLIIYGLFAALTAILIYFMAIVRKVFVMTGMTGTLIIALAAFVVSALTIPFYGLSVSTMLPDAVLYSLSSSLSGEDFLNGLLFMLISVGVAYLTYLKIRDHRVMVFYKKKAEQEGTN